MKKGHVFLTFYSWLLLIFPPNVYDWYATEMLVTTEDKLNALKNSNRKIKIEYYFFLREIANLIITALPLRIDYAQENIFGHKLQVQLAKIASNKITLQLNIFAVMVLLMVFTITTTLALSSIIDSDGGYASYDSCSQPPSTCGG